MVLSIRRAAQEGTEAAHDKGSGDGDVGPYIRLCNVLDFATKLRRVFHVIVKIHHTKGALDVVAELTSVLELAQKHQCVSWVVD